ncbi:MAG: hypothetical protein AAF845_12285 [Bacteroidota bacterium]
MSSYTYTDSTTFTITHARHTAAKVATDLKRLQRFYSKPSDASIADYEDEVVQLLKNGYLGEVTYGFKRNGLWITPTLKYRASELSSGTSDDPGRIRPGADISGASFSSYLTYSDKWWLTTQADRDAFGRGLPFQRSNAAEPGVNGYFASNLTYSAGGRALSRSSVLAY